MTRRNIVGMLLSRFNYNRVTVTIVHISVREWLPLFITIYSLRRDRRVGDVGGRTVNGQDIFNTKFMFLPLQIPHIFAIINIWHKMLLFCRKTLLISS